MGFLKGMYLKHQAKKIVSDAIISENGLDNAPGEMVSDIPLIDKLSDGLMELVSKNMPEGKEDKAFIEGVSEALIQLSVPSEDREVIIKHAENILEGDMKGDLIFEQLVPEAKTPKEQVVINTLNFAHASTLMVDRKSLDMALPKAGSCIYLYGAASYWADRVGLDEGEFSSALLDIIKGFGISHGNAEYFIDSLEALLEEPLGEQASQEGYNAIMNFSECDSPDRDKAALRLKHLVEEWAEL